MKINQIILWVTVIIFLFSFVVIVSADNHLPPGLLKAIEANQGVAQNTFEKVSFAIAFFAGLLTLLSPCILPLLPAFFAYTFKEKKQITKMTFLFFLGFTLMFIVLGLIAALFGSASIIVLQQDIGLFVSLAGMLLILFGLFAFFGKGFSGFVTKRNITHDTWGIFTYGMLFALGWTVCVGPILSGILIMASMLAKYVTAAWLMFFYSLGMFFPLFIISFTYDRFNLASLSIIKGKVILIPFGKKQIKLHTTNMLSGLLLIITGIFFLLYKGTGQINSFQLFGLKSYFYSIQNRVLENPLMYNFIGIAILVILLGILWKTFKRKS